MDAVDTINLLAGATVVSYYAAGWTGCTWHTVNERTEGLNSIITYYTVFNMDAVLIHVKTSEDGKYRLQHLDVSVYSIMLHAGFSFAYYTTKGHFAELPVPRLLKACPL